MMDGWAIPPYLRYNTLITYLLLASERSSNEVLVGTAREKRRRNRPPELWNGDWPPFHRQKTKVALKH